jgi:hypothetical protein
MLVFSTQLCDLCSPRLPLSPSLWLPPPPPPSMCQSTVYTNSVWLGGGGVGVLSCVGDHILQEFYTLYLTRFGAYKIDRPPQDKNLGGEGASDR